MCDLGDLFWFQFSGEEGDCLIWCVGALQFSRLEGDKWKCVCVCVFQFSGLEGDKWKDVAAKFCQHQSHALEMLRVKQRKDQKLALFLQVTYTTHGIPKMTVRTFSSSR